MENGGWRELRVGLMIGTNKNRRETPSGTQGKGTNEEESRKHSKQPARQQGIKRDMRVCVCICRRKGREG